VGDRVALWLKPARSQMIISLQNPALGHKWALCDKGKKVKDNQQNQVESIRK